MEGSSTAMQVHGRPTPNFQQSTKPEAEGRTECALANSSMRILAVREALGAERSLKMVAKAERERKKREQVRVGGGAVYEGYVSEADSTGKNGLEEIGTGAGRAQLANSEYETSEHETSSGRQ